MLCFESRPATPAAGKSLSGGPRGLAEAVRGAKRASGLLVVHDFGFDDGTVVLAAAGLLSGRLALGLSRRAFAGLGFLGRGLVKLRRDRLPGFIQFFAGRSDGRRVAPFERFLQCADGLFNFALIAAGNLVGVLLQHFFGAIDRVVPFVARFGFFLALAVVF